MNSQKFSYTFARGDGSPGNLDGWRVEVRLYSGTGQYAGRGDVIVALWDAGNKREARGSADEMVRQWTAAQERQVRADARELPGGLWSEEDGLASKAVSR